MIMTLSVFVVGASVHVLLSWKFSLHGLLHTLILPYRCMREPIMRHSFIALQFLRSRIGAEASHTYLGSITGKHISVANLWEINCDR